LKDLTIYKIFYWDYIYSPNILRVILIKKIEQNEKGQIFKLAFIAQNRTIFFHCKRLIHVSKTNLVNL
jgi:hypothetical protein